jgi:2-polyprenyl-6-methoxyphenol hydroxylase-like FAD-dependent oxidoreductase
VIDRDRMPDVGEHRRGVPQGRHTHGLLIRGADTLEELFPGYRNEVLARGGLSGDPGRNFIGVNDGVRSIQAPLGRLGVLAHRPVLEGVAREMLRSVPGIAIIEGAQAVRLVATPDRSRVTGLVTVPDGGGEETVHAADLVVDSSGRGSKMGAWLEALGYERPAEEYVKVDIHYRTRLFRRDPNESCTGAVITATPTCRRLGALIAISADTWIVTLAGYLGEEAPEGHQEFLDYAKTLATDDIYQLIKDCEPIGEGLATRYPASRRLRYEQVKRFPEGLLVTGDAIASFNPVYGQGMSAAAGEALALRNVLAKGRERLAQRFFAEASKVVDIPWSVAIGNDLRIPGVEGKAARGAGFINWYVSRLNRKAATDPVLATAFREVVHLLAPPQSIMRPALMWRVLFGRSRPSPSAQPEHPAEREQVAIG